MHVPFCISPCFYCGCNRIITRDVARGETYLARLYREIELASALFDRDREVVQLHFGGGTPNFLSPAQLARSWWTRCAASSTSATPRNRDFSIELDPRFLNPGDIGAAGRDRLQPRQPGRAGLRPGGAGSGQPHPERGGNPARSSMPAAQHGFRSVNVDLIYGLPKQTLEGFARTLDTVIDVRPDRLAVYGYAHLPQHVQGAAPDQRRGPAARRRPSCGLLQLAIDKLTAAGYVYIGMDHFALPDDELALAQQRGSLHRNFMGYTTHADTDLVGLGVSAISHIGDSFSQNPRDLPSWQIALDDGRLPVFRGMRLDDDDVLRADLIQQLMCQGEIADRRAGAPPRHRFRRLFRRCAGAPAAAGEDGLVRFEPGRIVATTQGRLLLRNIAMCFDRYLQTPADAGATPAALLARDLSAPGAARERHRVPAARPQHPRRRRRRAAVLLAPARSPRPAWRRAWTRPR